jgi:hypothetical protein
MSHGWQHRVGSFLWPCSKLFLWVTEEMTESLLDAECHKWWRWLAWVPKEQPDEKDGDGGLKLEWRSSSEVVENNERYSPFIEGRHGATTVAYHPLVVGLVEGLERWLLRWGGDGVIENTRQVGHIYVGGQTTVKTWSWWKKWDEKNLYGQEFSVFSLDHCPEFMMIGPVSLVGPKIQLWSFLRNSITICWKNLKN